MFSGTGEVIVISILIGMLIITKIMLKNVKKINEGCVDGASWEEGERLETDVIVSQKRSEEIFSPRTIKAQADYSCQ